MSGVSDVYWRRCFYAYRSSSRVPGVLVMDVPQEKIILLQQLSEAPIVTPYPRAVSSLISKRPKMKILKNLQISQMRSQKLANNKMIS